MGGWQRVGHLLEAVAVVFVVAMIAGQILGQPVLLGYVTTDSMEPALEPGDGFVAIPAAVSGPIEQGDVVVFEAESLHGGGLTTHRVVSETEDGYVTKGDANPFTDQDNEEPPVKDAQVVATVWQPGGSILVIPELGTAVTGTQNALGSVQTGLAGLFGTRSLLGTQGLAYLLFGLSVIAYLLDLWLGGGTGRRRERSRTRASGTSSRLLVAGFAALVVLSATAAMVVPAGQEEIGFVSAESDSPGLGVIEQGTSETTTYPVANGGLVPVVAFVEPSTERVAVEPTEFHVPPRTTRNASLTVSAPPETGYYREFVVQHRYLGLLPTSTIRTLYEIHPWLPLLTIDALLGGGFYLGGVAVLGTGRLRSRTRSDTANSGLLD
ncbi:S26 family signal peptidase [Halorientalis salina]|uniref:S26 family signal peptidase n=1 Tax=Halorientalis salina TaxID=2932266 RepID=UPI0010ABFB11|nr:S26 family signal peptidase [Halorientalis salina]